MSVSAKELPESPAAGASVDAATYSGPTISMRDLKTRCCACSMRELCLPMGFSPDELKQVDALIGHRIKLEKGESLYRAGDPFIALYATRLGSLKTLVFA